MNGNDNFRFYFETTLPLSVFSPKTFSDTKLRQSRSTAGLFKS